MADKDEYHFEDPDAINPELFEENLDDETPSGNQLPPSSSLKTNNVLRNALIAVILVVLIMFIYKMANMFITEKKHRSPKQTVTRTVQSRRVTATTPVMQEAIRQTPVIQESVKQTTPSVDQDQTNQRFYAIEQKMRSEADNINARLSNANNTLNAMNLKITELNTVIDKLNAKLDAQTVIIERLTAARVAKKTRHRAHKAVGRSITYFVQAAIPGRAWLIAPNGTTLTVREGTPVRGYGIVKLIDPTQGRVLTSSGRVITFNQEDS